MRRRARRPAQALLFELEEGLYAQEEAAWATGVRLAGVDEVGRGPLAGPVVAAVVVLDPRAPIGGLRDSKLLSPRQRVRLARVIRAQAVAWAVGRVGPARVDTDNVLQATWRAMRRALGRLAVEPGLVLVDGPLRIPRLPWPQRAIVRGDRRCASIAAASILAKVARDAFMIRVDRRYPDYGFRQHKGYATAAHLEALARLGPCPLHRRSFRGVLPRSGSTPQDDAGPRLWP
ncbi:MAG: ribonuclease HII [Candidatus Rokuibacteriota bacterium]|nr:MAG: ribonuclease HII [Candidatus Rokubacteria bacterium]